MFVCLGVVYLGAPVMGFHCIGCFCSIGVSGVCLIFIGVMCFYRGVTCFVIGLFVHQKLLGVCVITSEMSCFVCIGHLIVFVGVSRVFVVCGITSGKSLFCLHQALFCFASGSVCCS